MMIIILCILRIGICLEECINTIRQFIIPEFRYIMLMIQEPIRAKNYLRFLLIPQLVILTNGVGYMTWIGKK